MPEPEGAGTLVCVGTSHRVAPVPFIERALAGAERFRQEWLAGAATGSPRAHELVLLATCNRVEVWAAVSADRIASSVAAIRRELAPDSDSGDRIYQHTGDDALRHLCRVAVGLDSMVIGEPQIAGQVARAFETVLHANGGAPVMARAAVLARLASRRARTETAIARGPASISTVAVHVAAERLGGLDGARVIVVGAGKIGRLACQALRDSGASLTIVNRTLARAEEVAVRADGQPLPLARLPDAVPDCDVIIASTASPDPIIDAAMLARRPPKLVVVDIAVPRNVSDEVGGLEGVELIGIDDLRQRVRAHLEERCREVPRAEAIIDDVLRDRCRDDGGTVTVIGDLRRRAERIRRRAVRRALGALPASDAATRERIEHLSRTIVNRLLHDPTNRLRSAADRGLGDEYARVAADLFALDQDDRQAHS